MSIEFSKNYSLLTTVNDLAERVEHLEESFKDLIQSLGKEEVL